MLFGIESRFVFPVQARVNSRAADTAATRRQFARPLFHWTFFPLHSFPAKPIGRSLGKKTDGRNHVESLFLFLRRLLHQHTRRLSAQFAPSARNRSPLLRAHSKRIPHHDAVSKNRQRRIQSRGGTCRSEISLGIP